MQVLTAEAERISPAPGHLVTPPLVEDCVVAVKLGPPARPVVIDIEAWHVVLDAQSTLHLLVWHAQVPLYTTPAACRLLNRQITSGFSLRSRKLAGPLG